MGMGNRIVPQVCANLAGEYVDGEMRYVCFQAQTGIDVSYKFEYFAQATKAQILYENTCQTNMSSIMLNADNGPGPCKGDPMGGGSVENGDWKFTWVFFLFFLSSFLSLTSLRSVIGMTKGGELRSQTKIMANEIIFFQLGVMPTLAPALRTTRSPTPKRGKASNRACDLGDMNEQR